MAFRQRLAYGIAAGLICICAGLIPRLTQAQKPGETEGDMVLIPAGVFLMGADAAGYADQRPQHEVALDAFWMDRYEVSNTEFAAFLNAMGNQVEGGALWYNADGIGSRIVEDDGYFKVAAGYENNPVVNVTWYGAWAYAKWQNKRLPTEAEWEKAASWDAVGNRKRRWPWGDVWDAGRLNCWEGVHQLPVPAYKYPEGASFYGVYNMAGNVWEWCADWYSPRYYPESPRENPRGPVSGQHRVIRGGSWNNYAAFTSTTYRSLSQPGSSGFDIGFRCVK